MEATVTAIDDLWWTATKFSDVLKVDRRVCQQALETAPYKMIGKRQVWHVREGFEAIYRRKYGLDSGADTVNPAKLPPKDRLDHFRAERERIKLAQEVRVLLPANEVETTWGDACKTIAQHLDTLADHLGRDAALPPDAVMLVQRAVDVMRERMYESVVAPNPETDLMKKPQLQQIPLDDLLPYARNAKLHPPEQIAQIAASIKEFGFNAPVLVDGNQGIIAGHGRVLAARKLGLTTVPCIVLDHLTETQKRAYIIADNRIGDSALAPWDWEMLQTELDSLKEENYDYTLTGFTDESLAAAVDSISDDFAKEEPESPADFKEVDEDIATEHTCPKCGYAWSGGA